MACVILFHAKNKKERMKILDSFSDNLDYEVITDLKKYVEQKYKGRFVEDEEDGGDSTQIAAFELVDNKDIPILSPMVQNDQMNESRRNVSTNRNYIEREEDGYGTFIPYRYRMVEPKKENNVTVEANNPSINPISVSLDTDNIEIDVPCLDNVVEMDRDERTGYVTVNDEIDVVPTSTQRRQGRKIKRARYTTDDKNLDGADVDNGNEDSPNEITKSASVDDVPSTSINRKSRKVAKRTAYSMDDEDGGENNAQATKIVTKTLQQQASKKQKSVDDRSNESDVVSVADPSKLDNTPSTSARRRSGRSVKRQRYATDTEESDGDDDGPVAKKENLILKQQSNKETCGDRSVKTGIECQKCMKQLNPQFRRYSRAKFHARSHTDLKRYKCSVKGCTYRSDFSKNVAEHMGNVHKANSFKPEEINLTTEQEEELDQVTKECFPGFGAKKEYKVCKVCQVAIANNSLDTQHHPKRHSLKHIDFMLYKCNQQKCQYETKYYNYMTIHLRNEHGIEGMSKKDTEIELIDDQKKEIDDMLKKCFPDEDEDVEE